MFKNGIKCKYYSKCICRCVFPLNFQNLTQIFEEWTIEWLLSWGANSEQEDKHNQMVSNSYILLVSSFKFQCFIRYFIINSKRVNILAWQINNISVILFNSFRSFSMLTVGFHCWLHNKLTNLFNEALVVLTSACKIRDLHVKR